MNVLLVLGCFLTVVNARSSCVESGGYPPSISIPQGNKWPNTIVFVRKGNPKSFECRATADPPAKYYWTVNATKIEKNSKTARHSFNENTGTLSIEKRFDEDLSGDYQCFAFNEHGTAMTPILQIFSTVAKAFKGQEESTEDVEVYVSKYLELECKDVPLSVPQWKFSWERGIKVEGKLESDRVDLGDRMVIDQSGNLHFLWTERSDNNFVYACATNNDVMLVGVRNTHTLRLSVKNGLMDDRPPELKYQRDVQVYAGQTAKLMCIFTYYSSSNEKLTINWLHNGENVGQGSELTLEDVQLPSETQNQEGEYLCEGILGDKKAFGKVHLKIVAPPAFIAGQEPETKSVPVEKDAVFDCGTTSHNSNSQPPVWMVNAEPLIGCPPHHFECTAKRENGFSECVLEKEVCNTFPDCRDESDEANCIHGGCLETQKRCGDVCIPSASPCIELQCDYPGFMCRNKKSCLPSGKRCDGVNDCSDASDELSCPGGDIIQINRFKLNSQRTQLTLPSVSLTDSMCFQCMVMNEYGTSVGDACLTVIDKIVILSGPNSTYNIEPGTLLDITIEATTDRLWENQMKFFWQWYVEVEDKKTGNIVTVTQRLPPPGKYGRNFRLSQKGTNMVMLFPDVAEDDTDAFEMYNIMKDRVYTVVIEHRYDRVELNFTVNGPEIIKPTGAPVVEAASSNLWVIALILAILILFIVVAMIICFMYRNRGGTYLLDKKEHQAGHDPAQELKDSGFHDVGRVDDYDDDKPKGDEASLSESVKPYESDDDPTEEYGGDFDVSKFNEDGSFIGLYGDKKSKYAKEATV